MNKVVKTFLTFVTGAIVGGFVTKKYLEHKQNIEEVEYPYEVEDTEDTENVDYDDVEEDIDDNIPDDNEEERVVDKIMRNADEEKERYNQLLTNLKYRAGVTEDSKIEPEPILDPPIYSDGPYLISQDEFEVLDDYESDEYIYYADRYITDSCGMPVSEEDIENCFGPHVDDYFLSGADQIWLRNERLKMDFSIIRDLDNFEDVAPNRIKRMVGLI